jgi:heptosyltransferase-1
LRTKKYDLVIDAQGLIKSAFLTYLARGIRCGLDRHSAWESLATLAYQRTYSVLPEQHAVTRVRQLFAQVLGYAVPDTAPEYKIKLTTGNPSHDRQGVGTDNVYPLAHARGSVPTIVFLHGTTWPTKHWPEQYWQTLAQHVTQAGHHIQLPWGNQTELERAQRIATISQNIEVLPKLNLRGIAEILKNATAAVAVDTGLGHLAAALEVPTISLYGPTDPKLTGTMGKQQIHLSAQFPCAPCLKPHCTYQGPHPVEPPCFGTLPPDLVWGNLRKILPT